MSTIKVYKPTTNARRHTSVIDYKKSLTPGVRPTKSLLLRKKMMAGRSGGKIAVRHQGGGARKMIRQIDFKRDFPIGFKVVTVEYDPTRTAFVCLVTCLKSGNKKYILHTKGLEVGQKVQQETNLADGNQVKLGDIPVGTHVSQIELHPGSGAKVVRSAGAYATVTAKDGLYVTLKLPSSEIRKFLAICTCVVNRVGNEAHGLVRLGKAGRVRNMGVRPSVRGKVMNPVDHPHGGGEARNSIGMKYPKTPWGKHATGVRTRTVKKASSRLIVSRRKSKVR